jgi:hypothetical protein
MNQMEDTQIKVKEVIRSPWHPTDILAQSGDMGLDQLQEVMATWLVEASTGPTSKVEKLDLIVRQSQRSPCKALPYPWNMHYSFIRFGEVEVAFRKAPTPGPDWSFYHTIIVSIGGPEGLGLVEGKRVAMIHTGITQYLEAGITKDLAAGDFWVPGPWENEVLPRWTVVTDQISQRRNTEKAQKKAQMVDLISGGIQA